MRQRVTVFVAVATIGLGLAIAAPAADVPIPGKVGVVKAGKLAKLVAKSATAFPLPEAGSAHDPTLHGATLQFFDTEFLGAGAATFTLDASGWTGLGKPAGVKGYRYKAKDDVT